MVRLTGAVHLVDLLQLLNLQKLRQGLALGSQVFFY